MPSLAKELMMQEVTHAFEKNPYAFISNFQGLTVSEIADFRRTMEKVSKRSLVVKHSMMKKVFANRQLPEMEKLLQGSVLITFGDQDPQGLSKRIVEFAKNHEKLAPAGVLFENQLYDREFVKRLARLPSRHELLTQVVTRVKSPITAFVMTLGQMVRGLVVVLNEVKKKRENEPPSVDSAQGIGQPAPVVAGPSTLTGHAPMN